MSRSFVSSMALAAALLIAGAAPSAVAQDAADTFVRVNRLENQVRQLSGQIEQLQFENRRLQEQMRRFQEDVEFRLNERGGARPAQNAQPQRRSDAFDPAADPAAPGAPQPLGATPPSSALPPAGATEGPRPLDLGSLARGGGASDVTPATGSTGPVVPAPALNPPANRPSVAAVAPEDAREAFDAAFGLYQSRQYDAAEMGFRRFLQSHPRDRLVPDATYLLGETYFAQNRYEEAGQQFLRVTTDHPRSAKAPDALVRLGVALNQLGAREQACATFAKAARDYPQAESVRRGLDRERQRARCAA